MAFIGIAVGQCTLVAIDAPLSVVYNGYWLWEPACTMIVIGGLGAA